MTSDPTRITRKSDSGAGEAEPRQVPLVPSDLFLSPALSGKHAQRYLQSIGFRNPAAADRNLRTLADEVVVRQALGSMADRLLEALLLTPDPDSALVGFSRYLGARTAKVSFLEYLHEDPHALQVLARVLGTSPFLSEILIRSPELFHWLLAQIDREAPATVEVRAESDALLASVDGAAAALDALKRFKRREILGIATRDILGRATLRSAAARLSDLASLLIERSLGIVSSHLLSRQGQDRLPGRFAVLGMGKLGGGELNYSSDIDLIYVYDPDDEDDPRAHDFFQRLARKLTAALGEHTAEGYLYRVDLRLRPMGRRGGIAYSLQQCAQYYETWGETFERFALIKARPIAGDPGLGHRFLDLVHPFVYRKYLDHAAVEEMYRYKARTDRTLRQREAHRNVKLGRGGIREVELFTQVLQLTYGASQPALRQRNTLNALDALRETGLISDSVGGDLARAYIFLRTVEHRLQIVLEDQTHSLSAAAVEREISARRIGFSTVEGLETELRAHRDRVHEVYRGLFERRRDTSNFGGRQFFRILSEDLSEEEALTYLTDCGLPDPSGALQVIRGLDQAASLAHPPSTARNVLANLLAAWMERVARCARPDVVLKRFEQLTTRTGAATMLYRSLLENEGLRDVLAQVLDSGDLLSLRVVRYPELLDSLLLPSVAIESLQHTFTARLNGMDGLERLDRMHQVRRFRLLEEFKILVEWMAGGTFGDLQEKLSLLADCCVARAARWHAPAESLARDANERGWAIVALGKLGGKELAVHSDLDLVVFYEGDPEDSATFVRYQSFVDALLAFLEEPTSEGVAYRIDTRLRPEGTKGALATPWAAFRRYLDTRAEAWERLAWTRCRLLVGSPRLTEKIQAAVTGFVYGPWDPHMPRLMHDIRLRMERALAHEGEKRIDFKVGRGGLADIDFLLQLVQIHEGGRRPEFRVPGTRVLLAQLPPTVYVSHDEAQQLRQAHHFLRQLEILARMQSDSGVGWLMRDPAVLDPLGRRLGLGERPGERLLGSYHAVTERVRSIYTAVLARLEGR